MTTEEQDVVKILEAKLAEQEAIYQQARTRTEQLRTAIDALRGNYPVVTLKENGPPTPRLPIAEMVRRAIEQIPDAAIFDYESVAAKGHTLFPLASEADIKRASYSAISGLMRVGRVKRVPGGFQKVVAKPIEVCS